MPSNRPYNNFWFSDLQLLTNAIVKTVRGTSLSICNNIVTIYRWASHSEDKWRSKLEKLSNFFNTARFTRRSSSGANGRCSRRRWRKSIQFAVLYR